MSEGNWIEWNAFKYNSIGIPQRPFDKEGPSRYDVILANGVTYYNVDAESLDWDPRGIEDDIVMYRPSVSSDSENPTIGETPMRAVIRENEMLRAEIDSLRGMLSRAHEHSADNPPWMEDVLEIVEDAIRNIRKAIGNG